MFLGGWEHTGTRIIKASTIPEQSEGLLSVANEGKMVSRYIVKGNKGATKEMQWELSYSQVSQMNYGGIEYSQLVVKAKKPLNYLTITFTNSSGHQEAVVFELEKGVVKTTLTTLEFRTGMQIHDDAEWAR